MTGHFYTRDALCLAVEFAILDAAEDDPDTVTAQLRYTRHDPAAVTVVFMFDGDPISTWVFGRDLLAEGLLHPSGADDVKVRTDADQLVLTLDSPSGHAELSTGLAMVEDWLAETLAMVPRHLEYDDLDVECGLLALLEAAS